MNPWWIRFFYRLTSCLPMGFCPSCGLPIHDPTKLKDPKVSLCDTCYKVYTQDEMHNPLRKETHGNHNQS